MIKTKLMSAIAGAGETLYSDDVFSTWLYTGNSSTQTITNGIDLTGKGGLVWTKSRNTAGTGNNLVDTARGNTKFLFANATNAEYTVANEVSSFNSNGYTLGTNGGGDFNETSRTYVSWTFRKAAKFFDCGTYTGNGVAGRQIPHSLGVAPGMVIVKCTSIGSVWFVYHRSLANTEGLWLQATDAVKTAVPYWNNQTPTDSVFYTNTDHTNINGTTYVWYAFAHDTSAEGIIQCGSFTTDGSGNATVNLGWEPQYLMVKKSSTTGDWVSVDVMREMSNNDNRLLYANTSGAEVVNGFATWRPNATGFTHNANGPSTTFIYLAIRRPNKPPTTGTQVFSAASIAGSGTNNRDITGVGFSPDLIVHQCSSAAGVMGADWRDVLRGLDGRLQSDNTSAEAQGLGFGAASRLQDGYRQAASASSEWNISGRTYAEWRFRRAPGVFDVVAYTGTGSARTVNHSLGAVPELMIVKSRSNAQVWSVYSATIGASNVLYLNNPNASSSEPPAWNSTAPTSTAFTVGGSTTNTNTTNATYIAYLFASSPGISKVGSYTGNGTSQTIDCGFSAGARFVLIKRTDSTGDWYVWDSVRGIVAANDPHLSLNTTAAEVTSNDSIDPTNAGFIVNQVAATNVNVTSATYIYLAFA